LIDKLTLSGHAPINPATNSQPFQFGVKIFSQSALDGEKMYSLGPEPALCSSAWTA